MLMQGTVLVFHNTVGDAENLVQTQREGNETLVKTQPQVKGNLAKKTAEILASSPTRSAQDAYTWWDWVFRGCVLASALILALTLGQCCYFRHLIRSPCTSTHAALVLSPLKLPTLPGLGP
ncbi:hypothetical protein SKAU_G00229460 [Synaphobranchus kaupii]|uniref:Uncharacterized protein n=1 Tax=Synaphobranchus kaupii TaxID=118154 RepID=A0A9Q1F5G8_SYNKA|nr:hypothetical protein SKAU_G00229460 [Synaphobranchus kaupii]